MKVINLNLSVTKMVQMSEEFSKMVIVEIEKEFKDKLEGSSRLAEAFEELKRRVKPKLFVAERELTNVAKIFTDF